MPFASARLKRAIAGPIMLLAGDLEHLGVGLRLHEHGRRDRRVDALADLFQQRDEVASRADPVSGSGASALSSWIAASASWIGVP